MSANKVEEAANTLSAMFSNIERAIIIDTFLACREDLDATVDQLLAMGCEIKGTNIPEPSPKLPQAPEVKQNTTTIYTPKVVEIKQEHSDEKLSLEQQRQELMIEMQKLSLKQKEHQVLEQNLERLRQFISSEQAAILQERNKLAEEKKKMEAELSKRFAEMKEDLRRQEEERLKQEDLRRQEKERRREEKQKIKEQRKIEKLSLTEQEETNRTNEINRYRQIIENLESAIKQMETEYHNSFTEMEATLASKDDAHRIQILDKDEEIFRLQTRVEELETKVMGERRVAKEAVLNSFGALARAIADGIESVTSSEPILDTTDSQTEDKLVSFQQNMLQSIANSMTAATEKVQIRYLS